MTALRVKHMAAQVAAALAKTEESLVSARIATGQGRTKARQVAEAALALAPDAADAHYAMGDVLADADDVEGAAAEYRKGLGADPQSSAGHARLANALRAGGNLPEAVAELREAIRLNSDYGWAYEYRAQVYRRRGQDELARKDEARAASLLRPK